MTEEQANDIDIIAKYLCSRDRTFVGFVDSIRDSILPNRTVNDLHVLFSLIEQHFSDYIEVQANASRSKFIRCTNLTQAFLEGNGFINYQKELEENRQMKVMEAANLYFNTETARRHFENYDLDKKRLMDAEKTAKRSLIVAIIAAILTAIGLMLQYLQKN